MGLKTAAQCDATKAKIRQTNLTKYGSENYFQTQDKKNKSLATSRQVYCTDHPSQSEIIKNKIASTCKLRYGKHFTKTQDWKNTVKEVVKERFGVDNVMQNEATKNKVKESLIAHYGVDSPLKDKGILRKAELTCLSKYGVTNYSQTAEYRDRYVTTSLARYGERHPMNNSEVLNRSLQVKIDRYGTLACKVGKAVTEFQNWLNSLSPKFDFKPNVRILGGREIDLYDETSGIGFEYCGLFWHNELSPEPRLRNYHYDKWETCI